MATTETNKTYATGKRKTAIARVTLRPGTGSYLVNGRALEDHAALLLRFDNGATGAAQFSALILKGFTKPILH